MADGSAMRLVRFLFPNGVLSFDTVILLACLLASYLATNALYYLTLHPLAKIPGPRVCAVTRIPYWYQCLKGNDVKWMHALHTKYGPVLRFGPTDIGYTSTDAWKDVHGYSTHHKEMEKAAEFASQPTNGVPSMFNATHKNHIRVRRLFAPAFSDRALKSQEHLFQKYVGLLLSKLHDLGADGEPVEMTRLWNFASFDTMAELCFGEPLGLLAKNEFSPWVHSIFQSLKTLPISAMINYYPVLKAIFSHFEPKTITAQRVTHCKHSEERVNLRLKRGSTQPDIWNLVMEADGSERGLSLEEMHSNSELFMVAGSETTATLLSGITYYLLINPDKMRWFLEELRGSFRSSKDINFENLVGLKYLNACIKEALRIYPPLPIGSPRVVPEGGQIILGQWIPEETRVSCHHWSTYRSELNFKNAEKFIPERWLGDPAYASDALESYQPFGYGPRNCIGQNMAMHELRLFAAHVFYNYDFQLCEESRNWSDQLTYGLWIKNPLMCRVTPVHK